MLIGRNPFPNKNDTLNNVNIARNSLWNDLVLFNLHESDFTNINYDLKIRFITNFSLSKSRSWNLSLLWNIDTFLKNMYMQSNTYAS